MNILVPDSWLREYLKTDATPKEIKKYLSLCGPSVERISRVKKDYVYNIEITSNRVDMASVYGIAREAKAILPRFGKKAEIKPLTTPSIPTLEKKYPIKVSDKDKLCDRLLAVVMDGVMVNKSPKYLTEKLEKSGARSLNNIIDITNYIMLEVGHPCHVFDYDRIKTSQLIIRNARSEETLITLDGNKYNLTSDDIIIDDGTGRIIDLPGIIGTKNSVVTSKTRKILLFIESNNPINIRKTSMRLGIRTMAATINEKHPDPKLAKIAFFRAIDMYREITKAKISSPIIDIYPNPPKEKKLKVSVNEINKKLGVDISKKEVKNILESLNFNVEFSNNNKLNITPPSYRIFDIEIPEDIVEEVARIYGYHNLPSKVMSGDIPISYPSKALKLEEKIKLNLKYWGFCELYNYSFISEKLIKKAYLTTSSHINITNPLTSDTKYMRISLIPSILENITQNQHHNKELDLFELSKVYKLRQNNLPDEISMLAISTQSSFYNIKGVVEKLFEDLGIDDYKYIIEKKYHFLHPKQSITMFKKNKQLATIGLIHPYLCAEFDIKNQVFIAYINVDKLVNFYTASKRYTPIPSHPPIIEDLSFVISKNILVGDIIDQIYKTSKLVKLVEYIDKYKNIRTIRITYQHPNKNLTNHDIKTIRNKIIKNLENKLNIFLKK